MTEQGAPQFRPYVSADSDMKEATIRALVVGLIMCVVLGAANAYLGLSAGMTIAATYPAAVIGMAVLKIFKGTILEENYARTVGSIGESVAAGCIFTIPAFFIAGVWKDVDGDGAADFFTWTNYFEASVIMLVGGFIGIFFVTVLRRVMVEDKDLPFPESVAAGEIHKAGRAGGTGAKYLFLAMGLGALIKALTSVGIFAAKAKTYIAFVTTKIGIGGASATTAGGAILASPKVSPAYIGVGYIIGPSLAALNFTGGLLAWGLFVPLILFFVAPEIEGPIREGLLAAGEAADKAAVGKAMAGVVWQDIVRKIAIGGMLMAAAHTLYKMRKSLASGVGRAIGDVKKAAGAQESTLRTDKDLSFKWVLLGIAGCSVATFFIYHYFTDDVTAALVATAVMILCGFFFSAVSGNLVGLIGSSNNPVSGLTISTLIIAAGLMVWLLGQGSENGVAAALGVAAVICVAAAVAGEMLQDLKVGHILGGTPWRMQAGNLIGIVVASFVMFFPLLILHEGDIKNGGTGLGGEEYSAPQASLMANLSEGIINQNMPWELIIIGIVMAVGFILIKVKSPMLVCVGMYLPLETTFAIFIGGLIKGLLTMISKARGHNEGQGARIENNGVLLASGLIAGEALIGLLFAGLAVAEIKYGEWFTDGGSVFPFWASILVFVALGWMMIATPLKNAGRPDEPAPPSAGH